MQERLYRNVPEVDTLDTFRQDIVYLAAPYTLNGTSSEAEQELRVEQITRVANTLMQMGMNVFSPVTHSHAIQQQGSLTHLATKDWLIKDLEFLSFSAGMFVLMLPDWEKSIGVKREIEYARTHKIPITFIYPDKHIMTGEPDEYEA